jgi:K+/H+ antiporter YhaU regulatory subunit KhtT
MVGHTDLEDDFVGIVSEIPLPGIGVRYEFVTEDGARVGVVHHRSGMRELVLFERDDPDTSHDLVRLSAEESRTLAELLACPRWRRTSPSSNKTSKDSPSTGCRFPAPRPSTAGR